VNPEIAHALEAIVLVADSPVETQLLAQLVEQPAEEVEAVLTELAAGYAAEERGFRLVRVAGGWRYQTAPEMAPYVERFVLEGQTAKLSAAALETLAIVAYKQPISRAQIAAIRGVSVDGVVRTLEQRGYIGEVARDPGPGQAVLFGTTPEFLEKMGLDSLAQLPAIAEFVPGADVVEALEQGLRVEAGTTDDAASTEDAAAAADPIAATPSNPSPPVGGSIGGAGAPWDEPAGIDDARADDSHEVRDEDTDEARGEVADAPAAEPADDRPPLADLLDGDPEA